MLAASDSESDYSREGTCDWGTSSSGSKCSSPSWKSVIEAETESSIDGCREAPAYLNYHEGASNQDKFSAEANSKCDKNNQSIPPLVQVPEITDLSRRPDQVSASPLKSICSSRGGSKPSTEKTVNRPDAESKTKSNSALMKSPPSVLKSLLLTGLTTENTVGWREKYQYVDVCIKLDLEEKEALVSDSLDKTWCFRSKRLYQSAFDLVTCSKHLPNLSLAELHRTRFRILDVVGFEESKSQQSQEKTFDIGYRSLEMLKHHIDPENQDVKTFHKDYLTEDCDIVGALEIYQNASVLHQLNKPLLQSAPVSQIQAENPLITSGEGSANNQNQLSDPRRSRESRTNLDRVSEEAEDEDQPSRKKLTLRKRFTEASELYREICTHCEDNDLRLSDSISKPAVPDRFLSRLKPNSLRQTFNSTHDSERENSSTCKKGPTFQMHELNTKLHNSQIKQNATNRLKEAFDSPCQKGYDYWSVNENGTALKKQNVGSKSNTCSSVYQYQSKNSVFERKPQHLQPTRKLFTHDKSHLGGILHTKTHLGRKYSPFWQQGPDETPQIVRKLSETAQYEIEFEGMRDDYYNNLLDWLPTGQIVLAPKEFDVYAIDLETNCMYQIAQKSSAVITAVKGDSGMSGRQHLALGLEDGTVKVFDPQRSQEVSRHILSTKRIGCISWKGSVIASGSRSADIFISDVRSPNHYEMKLRGHEEEVCGLSWSPVRDVLASGGNENTLNLWDIRKHSNYFSSTKHKAAVKAIDFSKTNPNLLLSGGGTKDHRINLWDSVNGKLLGSANTNSQICALISSPFADELVTSEGAHRILPANSGTDLQKPHNLYVWKITRDHELKMIACIMAHHSRVAYMALNPKNGQQIVTGASDQRLRIFDIFGSSEADDSLDLAYDEEISQNPYLQPAQEHLR